MSPQQIAVRPERPRRFARHGLACVATALAGLVLATSVEAQRPAGPRQGLSLPQQPVTTLEGVDAEVPLLAPADDSPTLVEGPTSPLPYEETSGPAPDAPWGDTPPQSPSPEGPLCAEQVGADPPYRHWLIDQWSLRHSSTHGRAMGFGAPLRGTSWLNRPYDVAVEFGSFTMLNDPADGVQGNNDLFGALSIGWDWDHYWGSQMRLGWSTPELTPEGIAPLDTSDNLFLWDASLMYYPWGDSRLRPYWRMGVGLTDLEYTTVVGVRNQDVLFTLPFGGGVKYQFRPWLVWRAEVMNNLAIGMNETNTLNNVTFTTGLEWRFGGRPSGYWAWSGRGGSW